MSSPIPSSELAELVSEFKSIRADMTRIVEDSADLLNEVHPEHQPSAKNLLHYLALRSRDLRPLQMRLAAAGLSSLGRAESHVLPAVDAVMSVLQALAHSAEPTPPAGPDHVDLAAGQQLLDAHTEAVLGAAPVGRGVAIMVTMPTEAADDYRLVAELLNAGMDCMRINCAHDSADEWGRMIAHLRRAEERHGRACRVLMDLGGPKVRTGPVEAGPAVIKFRPERDLYGRVTAPSRVWLSAEDRPRPAPTPAAASLPVPGDWLRTLEPNDRIRFVDTRGADRHMHVIAADGEGWWAVSERT
jgi:pyruvate kinase